MGIDTQITGSGKGNTADVTDERAVFIQTTGLPPLTQTGLGNIYRQYLTDNGTSTGSNDMLVTGTATAPQLFWTKADPDYDIFINSLSFVISDASATLNKFGNITALTNGCELVIQSSDGEIVIADSLKTNFEFVRLCQGNPAFGDGTAAFRAGNVSGSSEGYIPVLDFRAVFGLQWGLRLRAGTEDKLLLRIKDDVSTIDEFNCIAYGFTRK